MFNEPQLEVSCCEQTIQLTRKEFHLFLTLLTAFGKVCPREKLLVNVWGANVFVSLRTIDRHVVQLRRKVRRLEKYGIRVETVWGIGYRLRLGDSL